MKRILILIMMMLSADFILPQQTLMLDECFDKARNNYPLTKQKDLIEQTKNLTVSNVWHGYLPQINISAQASYQSDVTSLPITLPGLTIDKLSQDQYKVIADVTQTIYDGGLMSSQSGLQESLSKIDEHKLEVELIKLKERVNNIFFSILLVDEQLIQTDIMLSDLNSSIKKLEAAYKNGIISKSELDVIKAEYLKVKQKVFELSSTRSFLLNNLGLLLNEKLDETIKLLIPAELTFQSQTEIQRPELNLLSAQKTLIDNQSGLSNSKIIPKASLFFQGGYGKPTLNMLKNNFDWFYIAGIRLSWSFSNLYSYSNENEISDLNKLSIETQEEAFKLNTNINLNQQRADLIKLEEMIKVDKEIIELRKSVLNAAKAKLDNGTITSNDYLRELNAKDLAEQNEILHRIQLLQTQYNYKITSGN
jgi:outer membrane protein TolC